MMEEFQISPEYCLMVRALARSTSLREAARLLHCDPTVLVRKAKRMSSDFGLIQKIRGRWVPTEKGQRAVVWIEQSIMTQNLALSQKPRQRVATTMWLAEELLIPNFRRLNLETNEKFIWSMHTASPFFEKDLLSGAVDYVIACHAPTDPMISHKKIAAEKWGIIIPKAWEKSIVGLSLSQQLSILKRKPYIRHETIVPELFLGFKPKMMEELSIDSLIGVRSAVAEALGWSCVPLILVQKELMQNIVAALSLPTNQNTGLCIWWLRARDDTKQNVKPILRWLQKL